MSLLGFLDYLLFTAAVIFSLQVVRGANRSVSSEQRPPAPSPPMGERPAPDKPPTASETTTTPLSETLRRIAAAGGFASPKAFLEGARRSYELTVNAFTAGDLGGHAHLLADDVRDVFEAEIAARRRRGETRSLTLIGFSSSDIVAAGLEGQRAWANVRFVAQAVVVTRDADGEVVAGHPEHVVDLSELWTFERDVASSDPAWQLVATTGDP